MLMFHRCASHEIFKLKQIRQIRRYLDVFLAKTLVHSFVIRQIDYCNGILASAPKYQIDQLQRVLNASARLVLKMDRTNHQLRPLVRDSLHWLRIPERIDYKLCTLVYKALMVLHSSILLSYVYH